MPRATSNRSQSKPPSAIAYFNREKCYVNMLGDYSYMNAGYYASQDVEDQGKPVHPTNKEVLDSYVVPLCLEKARLAEIPIPVYYITNDYLEPPVIVDSMNPFMERESIVLKTGRQFEVSKSLTRNYTYAISCQELPPESRVGRFRAILGWSLTPQYRPLAAEVWGVFKVPLAEVRSVVLQDGTALLSAIKPLPYKILSARERDYINKEVTWQT